MPRLPLSAFLLAAVLAACTSTLTLDAPPREVDPDDFESVLDDWTRSGADHHNVMEGRLFVTATYLAPAFRTMWLARAEVLFAWDRAARTEAAATSEADAAEWNTFFVAVATYDWRWNRLERPESIWYVWLEDDAGAKVKAARIERIPAAKRGEYKGFYPYLDEFHEGYLVRFPRRRASASAPEASGIAAPLPRIEPGATGFTLRVTGAPAAVELRWELTR